MSKKSSWVNVPNHSDFTIYNLPYGIFSTEGGSPKIGVAIGEQILDLKALAELGYLDELNIDKTVYAQSVLNPLMETGFSNWAALRNKLTDLLSEGHTLQSQSGQILVAQTAAHMHMPFYVRDYTDFYSSKEHATNVGTMFRDPKNALLPNWKHLPVGYHGRASSIVVSGTNIHRPKGQTRPDMEKPPIFGPSRLLDFELEMGFVIGQASKLGSSITTANAAKHIFGLVLFNDWSARDIQKWEYVPLGPFLGKSFASSVSPWVVPLAALDPFKIAGPEQDTPILPYLEYEGNWRIDMPLEVLLQPKGGKEQVISRSNYKYMYWNMAQQLAHHTVNGCNVNVGDLMASGTISGTTPDSYGSMLELSWRGTKPIQLEDGSERKFIADYDTIIMRGSAEKDGIRVGFGEVSGMILPAT